MLIRQTAAILLAKTEDTMSNYSHESKTGTDDPYGGETIRSGAISI